ncbi:hypothetical protein FC84_GL000022 [Lapidilactobacillus dextrinicus DSM 20335]|uniref:Uncharacterized protein n=1 Tax=Lapidilactobacillus dextrinicus DSM 20335 TaxID=1423738 RepID=A0A0R2BJ44_9LACO|nr:hypothetical protein [Lapidilactobacillus dextrinicus]KRM78869.1 hypothetical protein FC84_GL000022 [Lapidilactobacillus dextrinicus DSM 20335]QFG47506.1 hypothetical protein LH506_08800 [Lapidilactobacillus dextrinicus]
MVKKKKSSEEHYLVRGLIFFLWLFLQLCNAFITLAVFDAYGNEYYIKSSVAWPIFTALVVYLLIRYFNYWICRLLGYHAESELHNVEAYFDLVGNLHGGYSFPTFVRTTSQYKKLYRSRSHFFQAIFYIGFVLITAGTAGLLMYVEFQLFNRHIPNNAIIFVGTVVILIIILYLVAQIYYAIFPKIFHLKVILMEHDQPVFARPSKSK